MLTILEFTFVSASLRAVGGNHLVVLIWRPGYAVSDGTVPKDGGREFWTFSLVVRLANLAWPRDWSNLDKKYCYPLPV